MFEDHLFLAPTGTFKEQATIQNNSYIASFDEVGRGCVFGPVAVGGVLFPAQNIYKFSDWYWYNLVKDSKQLSEKERETLFPNIKLSFITGVCYISVSYIDQFNINKAIKLGIYKLMLKFNRFLYANHLNSQESVGIELALIDGNYNFDFSDLQKQQLQRTVKSPIESQRDKQESLKKKEGAYVSIPKPKIQSIIKGDQRLFTIACASILAKVYRDQMLKRVSQKYARYAIEKNKGYGTKEHLNAIKKYGMTKLHRKSFLKKYSNHNEQTTVKNVS